MVYSYNRLWKLMIDKKINKTALRREAGITSNAMAKMGKDLPVSVAVLAKICRVLDCTDQKRRHRGRVQMRRGDRARVREIR